MLYYKFTIESENINTVYDRTDNADSSAKINMECQRLNDKQDYNVCFFVSEIGLKTITLCAAIGSKNKRDVIEMAKAFVSELGFTVKKIEGNEIPIKKFAQEAHRADRHNFIDDEDVTLTCLSLGPLHKCMNDQFSEEMIEYKLTYEEALSSAKDLHFGTSLLEEIERIYADVPHGYFGHPVHYIIKSDDEITCKEVAELLVRALISVGRLKSRRFTIMKPSKSRHHNILDIDEPESFDVNLAKIVSSRQGGGAFISFPGRLVHEVELINSSQTDAKEFAEMIDESREDTLFITVLDKSEDKSIELLENTLQDMCFITISDNVIFKDEALTILMDMAKEKGIENCESLLTDFEDKSQGYFIADLERIFKKWNENRLRKEIYTQYRDFYKPRVIAEKPKGDAYSDLNSLIGLNKAKEVIQQALDFNKVSKLYSEAGIPNINVARHMVFTGNPGTAKTTVARLFAQILKDNGILSAGKLIEVGRQDLVGKYVGWTAPLVEQAFNKAKGSVLFIDEAYSLCEDRGGMYGDEAINTIVQLMENRRDDTIVILAGYPDKMEDLLSKNPGLRSRIAFHINFDDYSTEDLIKILHLMANEKKRKLSEDVDERVRAIISKEIGNKDFGNGRFIRNLFEQAMMRQASRIVLSSDSKPDKEILSLLNADDFGNPDDFKTTKTRKDIGFAC